MNTAMTFSIAVDLTQTNPSAQASLLALGQFQTASISTPLSYGSDWIFNPSTLISVCSNFDGASPAICDIENFKVLYRLPTQYFEMPFSNQGFSS